MYESRYKIVFFVFIWVLTSLFRVHAQEPQGVVQSTNRWRISQYLGYIYIEGKVDSVDGNFVFDTGASNFYFDSTYYKINKFAYKTGRIRVRGTGINPTVVPMVMDSIQVRFANNLFRTRSVPIIDFRSFLGDKVDGIIGIDYFMNNVLEINFVRKYMQIHQTIDSIDLAGYTKIPFEKENSLMRIPLTLKINESVSVSGKFLVDFGYGGSVILSDPISKKYDLGNQIKRKIEFYSDYRGVQGSSESVTFIARGLQLDKHSFGRMMAEYSLDSLGFFSTTTFDGVVGNEIFRRFDLLFDLQKNNLYLKPNSFYLSRFNLPTLGFSYVDMSTTKGGLFVTGIYKDSPADRNGLLINDKIIAINGIDIFPQKRGNYDDIMYGLNELYLKIDRKGEIVYVDLKLSPLI